MENPELDKKSKESKIFEIFVRKLLKIGNIRKIAGKSENRQIFFVKLLENLELKINSNCEKIEKNWKPQKKNLRNSDHNGKSVIHEKI